MTRRVFYSFDYEADSRRASMVRNMGVIEGKPLTDDNDWEDIGDCIRNSEKRYDRIKKWIDRQMQNRTCAIVLIGEKTYESDWVKYEICEAWESGMGVVGIHIYGLRDPKLGFGKKGRDPFDVNICDGTNLYSLIDCYDPAFYGVELDGHYRWVNSNLVSIIENAIEDRKKWP